MMQYDSMVRYNKNSVAAQVSTKVAQKTSTSMNGHSQKHIENKNVNPQPTQKKNNQSSWPTTKLRWKKVTRR